MSNLIGWFVFLLFLVLGMLCYLTLNVFVCHVRVVAVFLFFGIHGANCCVWLGVYVCVLVRCALRVSDDCLGLCLRFFVFAIC